VKVWNAVTGEEIVAFPRNPGVTSFLKSVAFTPDSSQLVTGWSDDVVRVWNINTGKEIGASHRQEVMGNIVIFSPDGTSYAIGVNRSVGLFDTATNELISVLRGHEDLVKSIAFTTDGSRLITGSCDKTVRIWDAATGSQVLVLRGHESDVNGVAISPNGMYVATASGISMPNWGDATARLWDISTGEQIFALREHSAQVTGIAFISDGTHIVTGSMDGTVRVWDARRGTEVIGLSFDSPVTSIAAHGQTFAVGEASSRIHVFDLQEF
jgi:WD40 repeat protein